MSSTVSRIIIRRSLVEAPKWMTSSSNAPKARVINSTASNMNYCYFNNRSSTITQQFSSTSNNNEPKEEEIDSNEEISKEEDKETPEEEAVDEVEQLKLQIKDYKDQLLRSLAEQENTRRIAKRDVESARSFSVSSFAKSLLDTSDNLTRAMDAVPEELRKDATGNPVLATLYEGIQMTDDGLNKAFAKHGLKKFGLQGEKFDPNKHEALFEYVDDKLAPGTVGQVMKVGFELNGRVIRSAEVGVTKKN